MKSLSDTQLSSKIFNSDKDAFKDLYYRYFKYLFHYTWGRISNEDLANEIVQETFIRLWETRLRINPKKSIKSLLFRIINNLIIDHSRKQKIRNAYIEAQHSQSNIDSETNIEFKIHLRIALDNMEEKNRTVFIMHHIDKFTYKEIANQIGVTKKTVENRMKKALKILQNELG